MMSAIETVNPRLLSALVALLVLLYVLVTGWMLKRKARLLWIPALFVAVLATSYYWYVYSKVGVPDRLPRLVLALTSALDMFLFKLTSAIGRLTDFFFLKPDTVVPEATETAIRSHQICLHGIYICALWTTSILIIHFFFRRVASFFWLFFHSVFTKPEGYHIFLGVNRPSLAVAKSIGKPEKVVFVELSSPDSVPERISFFQLFQGVKASSSLVEQVQKEVPGAMILKARKGAPRYMGHHLFKKLGLERLSRWDREGNAFYLLSDNQGENLNILLSSDISRAEIYCHAEREGLALRLDLSIPDHFHLIDSSFLAMKSLKMRRDLHPVEYVRIARDADGEPMGYVESPFRAWICGFGEAGQGALSFLYEFGALVGKNREEIPFRCEIFDRANDALSGAFFLGHPDVKREKVAFSPVPLGSTGFWSKLMAEIDELNYVVVSLGKDEDCMNLALQILDAAHRYRKGFDRFVVVVKLDAPEKYREMVAFYNENYCGKACLKTIGDTASLWSIDNISNGGVERQARSFYEVYASVTSNDSWDERKRKVNAKEGVSPLARKMELRRKTGQDFANFYHLAVKDKLCPDRLKNRQAADTIPLEYEGAHYTGCEKRDGLVLEYLAIGEHLRWNASHEMAGYRYADAKSEDKMTHPDMVPYASLNEITKHYDWLVVKTSLQMLGDRSSCGSS